MRIALSIVFVFHKPNQIPNKVMMSKFKMLAGLIKNYLRHFQRKMAQTRPQLARHLIRLPTESVQEMMKSFLRRKQVPVKRCPEQDLKLRRLRLK
jgi:hypothetical protein